MTRESLTHPLDLSGEFPAPEFDEWRETAEASLKGKPLEALKTKTLEGIDIDALYTARESGIDPGYPGMRPFARGFHALGNRGFVSGCLVRDTRPADAAQAIAHYSDLGMRSFWLHCCDLKAEARDGIVLGNREDVDIVAQAIAQQPALVHVDGGAAQFGLAAAFVAAARNRELPLDSLSLGCDPLATLAADGVLVGGIKAALDQMIAITKWSRDQTPSAIPITISSLPYHRGGASAVEELAFTGATTIAYLRALNEAGFSATEVPRLHLVAAVGRDAFMEIARLRATRLLIAKIFAECGLELGQDQILIHALSSPRTLSQRDPWVNLLRVTVETFAATVGGADFVTSLPFDFEIGQATAQSRRLAANTQTILCDESHLSRVIDPAGGSWYVENLTNTLTAQAFDLLKKIEGDGGMTEWLRSGAAHELVAESCYRRFQAIAKRKDAITGVSSFPNPTEDKLNRKAPQTREVMARVLERAPHTPAELALFSQTLATHGWTAAGFTAAVNLLQDGVSVPELEAVFKPGFGIPIESTPFKPMREAAPFEELRDRSDEFARATGSPPSIFLANLGSIPEHKARAGFATNFMEAAGFRVIGNQGFETPDEVAEAFIATGARAAVICSSDTRYEELAAATADALVQAGAARILLAGKPGQHEEAWRAAGVDTFIHLGCDVLGTLIRLHADLGVHNG